MGKKIILKGRVQGVGCRGYCALYARGMGLRGAATNMSDGSVRILLSTDDGNLVSRYVNALIANPQGYHFYGRITDADVSEYSGNISGDYLF